MGRHHPVEGPLCPGLLIQPPPGVRTEGGVQEAVDPGAGADGAVTLAFFWPDPTETGLAKFTPLSGTVVSDTSDPEPLEPEKN